MHSSSLRARTVGEILDLGFQLYRRHFVEMAFATAVLVLPLMVVEAVAPMGALDIIDRLGNLFFMAASAAVVLIASAGYRGESMDAMVAVRQMSGRFPSVWGAAIIQSIVVAFGFVLLIIPGFIFAAWTFGMQQAVMIEGADAGDSFERSKSLARDHFWHIAGTSIVAFLIVFVVMVGAGSVLGLVFHHPRTQLLATNLVLITLNPFAAVVGTVLYYDLRIRKEGYDVQVLTEQLGAGRPVPAL